ncbi:hypothetical protein KGP36_07305 [Patescibacteria group bacterium]|nr:hypothetical protein [Patescibacteria group bacterium]
MGRIGVRAISPKVGASFAKQYGSKDLLVPHLNAWFSRGVFPDEIPILIQPNKAKDDAFHPSSDCLDCARVIFARRAGLLESEPPSLELMKSFIYGHFIHGLIYFILKDLGFTTDEEIEFPFEAQEGGLQIKGHIDVRKCNIPGQTEPFTVDIKSQAGFAFNKPYPEGYLYEKYKAQMKTYMYFTGVGKTIILWAEKDTPHGYKETIISADDNWVEHEILSKWDDVVTAEQSGSIPDCTCGLSDCVGTAALV